MKAISLWQPWASLIAVGCKTRETRAWRPPASMVGERIAIHAARTTKGIDVAWEDAALSAICLDALGGGWSETDLPLGAIVATAVLSGASPTSPPGRKRSEASPPEDDMGDYTPGRWVWFLEHIRRLPTPIPTVGRQGFWEVGDVDKEAEQR